MSQVDDCEYVARPDNNMRSLALDGLEWRAMGITNEANSVRRYLRVLDDMPIYDTRAEGAIKSAEIALREALYAITSAQEHIAKFRA